MCDFKNVRYSVALIHNQNVARLAHARPAAERLANALSTEFFEVFAQPEIVLHSRSFALWRSICYRRADRLWRAHRGLPPIRPRVEFRLFAKSLLELATPTCSQAKQRGAIEMIIAGKHIDAWRGALRRGADFLIVLEDDAVLPIDVGAAADRIRNRLEGCGAGDDVYIDLAGGIRTEGLNVAFVPQQHADGWISYRRPVTNTACAYGLAAATAAAFCEMVDRRPWYRHLCIDWMIDMLMVERLKAARSFACFHASPPIFGHGSMIGAYAPWARSC